MRAHAPSGLCELTSRTHAPLCFSPQKLKQLQEATAAMQAAVAHALGARGEEEEEGDEDTRSSRDRPTATSHGMSTGVDRQAAWQSRRRRRRLAAARANIQESRCDLVDRANGSEYSRDSELRDGSSKDRVAAWRGQLAARAGDAAAGIAALYLESMVAELRLRLPAPSVEPLTLSSKPPGESRPLNPWP